MKKQNSEFPISPQEYKEELRFIHLKEIRLDSCSAKIRRERLGETNRPLKVEVKSRTRYQILKETIAVLTDNFSLIGTQSTKRKYAIKIECEFSVIIEKEKGFLKKEFLETYLKLNLEILLWPYFREFIHSMTNRMGIPPIILPFLKTP